MTTNQQKKELTELVRRLEAITGALLELCSALEEGGDAEEARALWLAFKACAEAQRALKNAGPG